MKIQFVMVHAVKTVCQTFSVSDSCPGTWSWSRPQALRSITDLWLAHLENQDLWLAERNCAWLLLGIAQTRHQLAWISSEKCLTFLPGSGARQSAKCQQSFTKPGSCRQPRKRNRTDNWFSFFSPAYVGWAIGHCEARGATTCDVVRSVLSVPWLRPDK